MAKRAPKPAVYAETEERINPLDGVAQEDSALVPLRTVFRDDARGVWLYHGDCLEVLDAIAARHPDGCFDMIFADPPYFLSNGGITCHAGKMVKVDKGAWDKSRGPELNHEFNTEWLRRCQRALKPDGTLWVTGTHHVIFSVGYAMQQLGFKILNDIAWEKPNPPPNLSCRYFTHSTETVIWAAKSDKSRHCFNYPLMRQTAGGKQMKTVWRIPPPSNGEKVFGKHPTQKPVALVERCLLASTHEGDLVLDPFMGSGTTGVACLTRNRKFVGIESDPSHAQMASERISQTQGFFDLSIEEDEVGNKSDVRTWLKDNGYHEIAELINRKLLDWKNKGKGTRRNWWDVLAGTQDGRPISVDGTGFPVLRAARLRKRWSVTSSCLCNNRREKIPPAVPQARWTNTSAGKDEPENVREDA